MLKICTIQFSFVIMKRHAHGRANLYYITIFFQPANFLTYKKRTSSRTSVLQTH